MGCLLRPLAPRVLYSEGMRQYSFLEQTALAPVNPVFPISTSKGRLYDQIGTDLTLSCGILRIFNLRLFSDSPFPDGTFSKGLLRKTKPARLWLEFHQRVGSMTAPACQPELISQYLHQYLLIHFPEVKPLLNLPTEILFLTNHFNRLISEVTCTPLLRLFYQEINHVALLLT